MKLLIFIFSALVSAYCQPKELATVISLEENQILVKLAHQYTKAELDEVKLGLFQKYNLCMNYKGSRFFDDGKARDLKIEIKNGEKVLG